MSEYPLSVTVVTVHAERAPDAHRWQWRFIIGDTNYLGPWSDYATAVEAIAAGTEAMASWALNHALGDKPAHP